MERPDEGANAPPRQRSLMTLRVVAVALVAVLLSTISISPAVTQVASQHIGDPMRVADGVKASVMPIISNVSVQSTPERTTITLRASSPVTIDAFALSAPYRVVVDMPEVHFDLATAPRDKHGLVLSWRAGLFATGRSRIVFDSAGAVRITSEHVEPRADGGAEIELELQSISQEQFAADERARQQAKTASITPQTTGKTDRETPLAAGGQRRMVVVLDPGHGGIDAGTVSPHTGMPEKQVVLEFSKLLEKKLTDTGRYQVFMTRSTDTFVPLGDRVKFARAHHADILVSIHADAELDRSVRGSTVFTRSEKASDAQAAALATKENQSDALAGIAVDDKSDDVADILMDLVRRETHTFSHALAEALVDAMSRSGHMVKQDPHRSASLVVLKAYDFPSVLIELGFLSNKDDEGELVSPKWRDQTATAIVTAIDRFFATHDAAASP